MTLYCGVCGKVIQPVAGYVPVWPCACSKPWPIEITFYVANHTTMLTTEQADPLRIREPKESKTEIPSMIYDAFSDSELVL